MSTAGSGSGKAKGKFAVVVGGGPAPGLNGVIGAAAIEAISNGYEMIGLLDGFKWLSQGDGTHVRPLSIHDVSRIHLQGGSIIRTSRANPTKDPAQLENVVTTLQKLGVEYLVTIGGDDTAFTASKVAEKAQGRVRVAHVPKTIDNDLPLPGGIPTFGYMTARSLGVKVVRALSEDARTTGRWCFVVAMGRTAGHLALGIGKAAGATVTIIPEEFGERAVTLKEICDILEGAIVKRLAAGRDFGCAILAEGLATRLSEAELKETGNVEFDEHGHVRLAEINLGVICREKVRKSMEARGLKVGIISKDVGYELRCTDPEPYDQEYTRDLGYGAVKFLLNGGSGAMITIQSGTLKPIRFEDLLDPVTHRTQVRLVDVKTDAYEVGRKYMIRLERADFADAERVAKLAATAKMTPDAFQARFGYLGNWP